MSFTIQKLLQTMEKDRLISNLENENWSKLPELELIKDVKEIIKKEGLERLDNNTRSCVRSKSWNTLAVNLSINDKLEEAFQIWQAMMDLGSDNPATMSNYGVYLLTSKPVEASKLIARAYDKDCIRPKGDALLLPAFKNLALALQVHASIYADNNERFTALMLGWQSIEYSLRSLWRHYINKMKISSGKGKDLLRWNINEIVWTLFLSGEISESLRNDLHTAARRRNRVLHAGAQIPTITEVKDVIKTSIQIHEIITRF